MKIALSFSLFLFPYLLFAESVEETTPLAY